MDFTALNLTPFGLGIYNVKDQAAREALTSKIAYAEYNTQSKVIVFYNTADNPTSDNILCYIDARDFIKDGMVDSVVVEDGNLVITFNTESGKEPIRIALSDIFNPDNYYTKQQIDNFNTIHHDAIEAEKTRAQNAEAQKANTADLESGAVVPALAGNLQSWDERGTLPKENEWDDAIRTSGGSMSIVSGQGADFLELKGGLGMSKVTAIRTTGFNKLRGATAIGNGYYFLVPRMVFGTYGTANENNGMLFTNSDHENLMPTVRFKALSAGMPTSVNDGSVCTYTDYNDTTKDKTYRFYTCSEIGYMIVSGITYADTCAHVGWSGRYDEFKSPTDADDAGTTLLMTAAINAMHSHGYMVGVERQGLLISDNIVQISKTQARWTSLCDIVKPTWTTIENEDGTYTHTATISAMLSGGGAYIDGINIEVEGNTISYTSNSDTPTTEYVCYEKTTATTGTVNLAQHLTIEDWGFEELVGMEGSVSVVMQYYMGYPDTLAAIAQIELKKVVETVDNLVEEVETEIAFNDTLGNVKALSLDSERVPMVSGRPMVLFAEGTPAEANIPLNWNNDTMGNWNGIPCFEGQLYINISASSGGLYYAVNTTAVGGWKQA